MFRRRAMLSSVIIPISIFFFCERVFTFPSKEIIEELSEKFVPCEKGWYFLDDKCYKIEGYKNKDDRVTWENASARCSNLGGKLVSIHSWKQNDLLTAFLAANVKQMVWIGLNDKKVEAKFSWEDGTVFDYSNWMLGQPDNENINEHCVHLSVAPYVDKLGKWKDIPCSEKLGYICQKEKDNSLTSEDQRFCSTGHRKGWKFRTSCYNVVSERRSWDDAEMYCQSNFNGHLAMISNIESNFFLRVLLSNYKFGIWIGIKIQNKYQAKWSSSWPVAYAHFDRPIESLEPGTCILRFKPNLWIPVICKAKFPFICETNSKVPPVLKPPTQKAVCPTETRGWKDFGGEYCYYINTDLNLSWFGAQRICIRRGGLLASITSKEEEDILHSYIGHKTQNVFIGLNKRLTNGVLSLWSDGSEPTYTHWSENESLRYNAMCAEISSADMKWKFNSCSSATAGFICQVKKTEILETNKTGEAEDGGNSTTPVSAATGTEKHVTETIEVETGESVSEANHLKNSSENYIPCEEGWYYFKEKCYKLGGYGRGSGLSYAYAKQLCIAIGGTLASIHSAEENDFISTSLVLNVATVPYVWVGLNDIQKEAHFVWEDSSSLDYQNWKDELPGEDANNNNCVLLVTDSKDDAFGKWIPKSCYFMQPYICQKSSNQTHQTLDPLSCNAGDAKGLKFQDKCYSFISDTDSWEDAEQNCQILFNGHLVSILDKKIDIFLRAVFPKLKYPSWIGIKTQDRYQQKWASGAPVAYNHFDTLLENIPNGTCILRWNQNVWTTADCGEGHPFVCEENRGGTPYLTEPSSNLRCLEYPYGWQDIGGDYCYFIDTKSQLSWWEAQRRCITWGGLLATIPSKELEEILHHFVRDTQERIYIGLNSLLTEGETFLWSDGTPLNYTHWEENEPNYKYEMCGEIWTTNMKWNDVRCFDRKGFICQAKKVPLNYTKGNDEEEEINTTTTIMTSIKVEESITQVYASETEANYNMSAGKTNNEGNVTTIKDAEEKMSSRAPTTHASVEEENTEEEEKTNKPVKEIHKEEEETNERVETHAPTVPSKEEKKNETTQEVPFPSNITLNPIYEEEEKGKLASSTATEETETYTLRVSIYVSLFIIVVLLAIWAFYSRKWIKHKTEILTTVFYRPSTSYKEIRNKWSAEILLDKNGEETYM